jgi:hypothetical protein
MNTKQLHLVTFEQAKRLKALGFNWEVGYFYNTTSKELKPNFITAQEGEFLTTNYFLVDDNYDRKFPKISAPTTALALKWMRDVKKIVNTVEYDGNGLYREYKGDIRATSVFNTYEAAEAALLDELLTVLEKGI